MSIAGLAMSALPALVVNLADRLLGWGGSLRQVGLYSVAPFMPSRLIQSPCRPGQHGPRHLDFNGFGRLWVDRRIEFRLLDRQVAKLLRRRRY
jgi:hypothetical protein